MAVGIPHEVAVPLWRKIWTGNQALESLYFIDPGFMHGQQGELPEMITGTVKWFNSTKGFGFIAPDDGSKDVFVHISAVERAGIHKLAEGQKVEFEVAPGRDGRTAADNLKLVE